MTNPDNAVGTNAAYGGRTSVNAFNDNLSAYSRGVMSGWGCTPAGGLVVSLGGNGTERDVAVAEDNIGNKTSINNISGSPITLTMSAAPGAGTRIDSIVAYVDASPQGEATVTDNYGACGLIVVQGTPSSTPSAPSDNDIRSAITSDGASGPTAYYAVLANINMASGTTDITDGEIAAGDVAKIASQNLDFASFSIQDLNFGHYTRTTISLGYGVSAILARIGNLVFLQGTPIINNVLPTTETSLSETIPAGYKPITGTAINAICGSETGKFATWWVASTGAMSLIATGFTSTAPRRVNVSSAWVTQDEWPS